MPACISRPVPGRHATAGRALYDTVPPVDMNGVSMSSVSQPNRAGTMVRSAAAEADGQ